MATTMEDVREFKSRRNRIALFSSLADTNPMIRGAAVIALIEIADPRDVDAVKQYLMSESDLSIRQQVLFVLNQAKIYDDPVFLDAFRRRNAEFSKNGGSIAVDEMLDQHSEYLSQPLSEPKTVKPKLNRMIGAVLFVVSLFFVVIAVGSPDVGWGYMILGLLSVAMAVRLFLKRNSAGKMDDSVLNGEMLPVENEEVQKEHFTRMYHHRDIFAMAILYQGELSEDESVTPEMIADEVVLSLHQEGRYVDSRLSLRAVVKMDRVADYTFFSSEDYLPGTDLDNLLQKCLDEVRQRMVTDDPQIEKIAAVMSRVKVVIPTLGVVWVGMYISMI